MKTIQIKRLWIVPILLIAITGLSAQIRPLAFYPSADKQKTSMFIYLSTPNNTVRELKLLTYNNPLNRILTEEKDITSLIPNHLSSEPVVIEVPCSNNAEHIYRLQWKVNNEENNQFSPYFERNLTEFDYLSDLPLTAQGGHGNPSWRKDLAYSNIPLNINGQGYAKGIGIHAAGWVRLDLVPDKYERFVTHVGKQQSQPYTLGFKLLLDGVENGYTGAINQSVKIEWDKKVSGATKFEIKILDEDGNGSDHASIGGARFYLTHTAKKTQDITWEEQLVVKRGAAFTLPLLAQTNSGLPIRYRLVSGGKFATIVENNLRVDSVPIRTEIKIEAFQPGDLEWEATAIKECTILLTRSIEIQKDETVTLKGGTVLEELIIQGDPRSVGQANVKSGIVQVNKLTLKFTFTPNQWSFISFPSDLNIDKISNLNELGYTYGTSEGASYTLKYYDEKQHSEQGIQGDHWALLTSPDVKAQRGYLMRLTKQADNTPCEVTFTIDNATLDFESAVRLFNLTLDFSQSQPDDEYPVYISPQNIQGNTLKVLVKYSPKDGKEPLNFAWEVKRARLISTSDGQGLRIALPDNTPAKVLILDKKGKKILRAIRYIAPARIDISDLKAGNYQLIIGYGNATDHRTFEKKR